MWLSNIWMGRSKTGSNPAILVWGVGYAHLRKHWSAELGWVLCAAHHGLPLGQQMCSWLRCSQTPLSVLWLPCKHTPDELSCSAPGMQPGPLQIDPNGVDFCVFEVWFAASSGKGFSCHLGHPRQLCLDCLSSGKYSLSPFVNTWFLFFFLSEREMLTFLRPFSAVEAGAETMGYISYTSK